MNRATAWLASQPLPEPPPESKEWTREEWDTFLFATFPQAVARRIAQDKRKDKK